jgi:hypothetical protein
MFSGVCMLSGSAQSPQAKPQFIVPLVESTPGRVTGLATGQFQYPANLTDILYVGAPVMAGATSSVPIGILLNSQGFYAPGLDQIDFQNVLNVTATVANFDGDAYQDFAFALTPQIAGGNNLCVYYGNGSTAGAQGSNYNAGAFPNAYPPTGPGKSGCLAFPMQGTAQPNLAYMAAVPFKTTVTLPSLVIEDSANNVLYILANRGGAGSSGNLISFVLKSAMQIPAADGAGPIAVGDFNNDGNTDFILNGQNGNTATIYLGDGAGNFTAQSPLKFDPNVHSLLIEDMDGDGIPDMVVEGDNGIIEIFKGATNGTFATPSEGGTAAGLNAFSGNGGHLVAIGPNVPGAANLEILTATPIGLSLLQHASGSLTYTLQGIYNIGPGRASYALAPFFDDGVLDLAVNSPEGVAIAQGNASGGFLTSNAYSSLQPALSAAVGKFRNAKNNPNGNLDVVVGTGVSQVQLPNGLVPAPEPQAQLLTGNGDGTFNTFAGLVDTGPGPGNVPAQLWSNVFSGDFDGDGNLDVLYSLTGLPQPGPSGSSPVVYIQYGIGDGSFSPSGNTFYAGPLASNPDGIYVESAVGDFNGDGIPDVATSNALSDAIELGIKGIRNAFGAGFHENDSNNADFSQVAAGFFKTGRTSQQDVIFEQGSSLIPYANAQDGTGNNFTAKLALTGAGAPLSPATVLLTDVDGDGNGDVVAIYYDSTYNPASGTPIAPNNLYIWWGNGDGTFTAPTTLSLSRNYYLGVAADMNSDGKPDLVLSDGALVSVLYNHGNRSFGTIVPTTGLYTSEQHFLAGEGINSLSLADLTGAGHFDLVVANGGVTIANPLALGGKTQSSVALTPNPDVNTGGITVLRNNITTQPVTGTLVGTPDPSSYEATFTLTATLTPASGTPLPTGTVQFYFDGAALGSPVNLVPGTSTSTATYTVPAGNTYASATVHTLTATYPGDAYNTQTTLTGTQQISGGPTTTTLYLCVGPTATCPSTGTVVPPAPPYPTSLTMYYGQDWNGIESVTAADGGPLTGNTVLYDAYTGPAAPPPSPLCSLTTQSGGTCPPSIGTTIGTSVGTNVFTSVYSGDSTHTTSTSIPVTIVVSPDTTTAALTGAPNPSPQGQPVTFTATVTGNIVAPTGPVNFLEVFPPNTTGTYLGTANLVPGTGLSSTATFTTSTLAVGSDSIEVSYQGTVDFNPAISPIFVETITAPISGSFTVSVTPTPVTVSVGYSTAVTVTVTPLNGFAQAVTLSCGNLPSETTCLFGNATIAAGGGATVMFVQTTAPHSCGTTQPYFNGSLGGRLGGGLPGGMGLTLPALAGLVAICIPGRRRSLRALLLMIVAAAVTQITGCGNCTDLGTRPNTYTFQVTGTAAGTGEVASQTVTLNATI